LLAHSPKMPGPGERQRRLTPLILTWEEFLRTPGHSKATDVVRHAYLLLRMRGGLRRHSMLIGAGHHLGAYEPSLRRV
jgi:hypothetical protein